MAYSIIVRDENGEEIYYGGMSFNWTREYMGVQNTMLAKKFGGFISEVVAEMCTNWFEHNLYFEDFGRFHKTSQKLICEMRKKNDLGKGLKGVEALVQLLCGR